MTTRSPSIEDREANEFAMQLLMPDAWLAKDIADLGGVDIEDGEAIGKLAKKYGVSATLMTVRIGQLMRWKYGSLKAKGAAS